MELREECKDETYFRSHHGLFRSIGMRFGLSDAPGTFQREIYVNILQVKWKYALVYLDDVVIFSKSVEQHFYHMPTFLSI